MHDGLWLCTYWSTYLCHDRMPFAVKPIWCIMLQEAYAQNPMGHAWIWTLVVKSRGNDIVLYIVTIVTGTQVTIAGIINFCCMLSQLPQVCSMIMVSQTATYSTYWCVDLGKVPDRSGYLFGGVYSNKTANPMTNVMGCPEFYYPLVMGLDLKVCVSDDYERGLKYSVPFAGTRYCACIPQRQDLNSAHYVKWE